MPRWGLFDMLRKQKPQKIAKTLVLNVVLTFALFLPIIIFLDARSAERVTSSNDKLPWLKFYGDPSTSMVISWETSATTNSYVEYGLSSSLGTISANATKEGVHHVYLAGLQPNTTYFYRVGTNDSGTPAVGSTYSFTTAPANTNMPFTFLAISDTQEATLGMNHHPLVASGLAREAAAGARFVLHGGDYADDGADQASWNYYFKHAATYSPNLPIMTAIGNHDNRPGQPLYRKYFAFRAPGEDLFYAFNYSVVHVLVLDIAHGSAGEFTPAMTSFIAADLNASIAMSFKIVLFHCPMISSGFFGINQVVMDNMRPVLARYNVTIVITGHDHHYERLIMDNTTHLVIGGGGGELDPCHEVLNETQAVASIPHYMLFRVDPATGITVNAVTPEGTVFDTAFFPVS
jgi:acid phosphatase type 7